MEQQIRCSFIAVLFCFLKEKCQASVFQVAELFKDVGVGRLKSDVKCYCMGSKMVKYRGADKSLARPARKQAAPVECVMGRAMDRFV